METNVNKFAQLQALYTLQKQQETSKEVKAYLQTCVKVYKARVDAILSNKAYLQAVVNAQAKQDVHINWDDIALQVLANEAYGYVNTLLIEDANANEDVNGHVGTNLNAVADEYQWWYADSDIRKDLFTIIYAVNFNI